MNRLHTTNSWKFLGIDSISQYNKLPTDIQSDVIIGVIHSGVWPESQSYNDYGLGPVPTRFKGECVSGRISRDTTATGNRCDACLYV
ncbi:putative tripeptidyl-peptidase II [Helianthus anomalus]